MCLIKKPPPGKLEFRIFFLSALFYFQISIAGNTGLGPEQTVASPITTIESEEQFVAIIDTSKNRLLVFDLYADWCVPCRIVTPTLEKLALENRKKASFFKINIDRHRNIAALFRVSGIPFIVFVKNKTGVYALTGVQSKEAYQNAINQFANMVVPPPPDSKKDSTSAKHVKKK
jgi:thioredoxin